MQERNGEAGDGRETGGQEAGEDRKSGMQGDRQR